MTPPNIPPLIAGATYEYDTVRVFVVGRGPLESWLVRYESGYERLVLPEFFEWWRRVVTREEFAKDSGFVWYPEGVEVET